MRKVCFFFLVFFFSLCAYSQKVYFIYLESDDNSSFYVRVGDKIITSVSGYLVLSNLVDSSYSFSLGQSSGTESRFLVRLLAKDRGFLIKKFDDGVGLFDLQNMSVTKPQVDDSKKNISYRERRDDFTTLLAKASNDSSLLQTPIVVKQEVVVIEKPAEKKEDTKTQIPESIVKTDTILIQNADAVTQKPLENKNVVIDPPLKKEDKEETKEDKNLKVVDNKTTIDTTAVVKIDPLVPDTLTTVKTDSPLKTDEINSSEVEYKRSLVRKYSESSTSEGFGLVFYDNYEGGADTIRLLIPNPKINIRPNDGSETADEQVVKIQTDTVKKEEFYPEHKKPVAVLIKCKSIASESDFFKLRKNMAGRTTDESMVDEAKKVFKSKCFSTEQIRNLGTLFLTSSGRYQFFDAAYLHVTDREQFKSLETEIKDDYYLKRFKALVGE